MIKVGVSVLNHHAAELTVTCVQHLARAGRYVAATCELRAWVLDNGSGEQDQAILAAALAEESWVKLLFNEGNSGFAAGHNRNLRRILAAGPVDYVWLLNNDCLVDEECLAALLDCSRRDPGVAIWGATLLEADHQTIQCAGGCYFSDWLTTYRQFGTGYNIQALDGIRPRPFDYIAGASMWLPINTLRQELLPAPRHPQAPPVTAESWLNETFFLYFEELDLAKRLKAGRRLGWCRDAVIVHGKRSREGDRERREIAEYHSDLSALKFTWLHQPGRLWFALPARYLLKAARHLLLLRWYLLPCMTRAYAAFFRWRTAGT